MRVIHKAFCVIKIKVPSLIGDLQLSTHSGRRIGKHNKEATVAFFKVLHLPLHAINEKNS